MRNAKAEEAQRLYHFHEFASAQLLFEEVLQEHPTYTWAAVYRAGCLLETGTPTDSLSAIDQILTAEPEFASAHYVRALILSRLNRYDESVAAAEEAYRLDPDPEYALDIAEYKYGAGQYQGALEA